MSSLQYEPKNKQLPLLKVGCLYFVLLGNIIHMINLGKMDVERMMMMMMMSTVNCIGRNFEL